MAQSARQLGPEENPNCISGKKFARGYKVPLRVDWALPGVHSMGAGAEAIRRQNGPSFPPNTDEQRRAAEWFNDTFRPIFG